MNLAQMYNIPLLELPTGSPSFISWEGGHNLIHWGKQGDANMVNGCCFT